MANKVKFLGVQYDGGLKSGSNTHRGPHKLIFDHCIVPKGTSIVCNRNKDYLYNMDQLSFFTYLIARPSIYAPITRGEQIPFVIGGDHSIAVGTWTGIMNYRGNDFALLWIDAHLDGHSMETSPSGNIHGTSLRTLLGDNREFDIPDTRFFLKPENVYIIGVRDYEKEEHEYLINKGVNIIHMDAIDNVGGFCDILAEISGKHKKIGISLDLDVLDPSVFNKTNTPVEGGLSLEELVEGLKELKTNEIVGLEMVEYTPTDFKFEKCHDEDTKTLKKIIETMKFVANYENI